MSYYPFRDYLGRPYGSLEVFFTCGSYTQGEEDSIAPGWYWQACFPGCLPDGDPMGPFETEEQALEDADVMEEPPE